MMVVSGKFYSFRLTKDNFRILLLLGSLQLLLFVAIKCFCFTVWRYIVGVAILLIVCGISLHLLKSMVPVGMLVRKLLNIKGS